MAIEDINISEQFETSTPNMEVAQGGPEDFMTDDEMDPYQDPEFQQLLDSLPGEQAEVLMQLIKEFKAMVAQGFKGEFEDFVKMKMATAQGGPEEFMSEEEMTISPEEQQSLIPMGQQVAHGGRIGRERGGIMDVIAEEQIETGPTPQQLIMAWLEARGLPPTPENIQKAILEMSREGQGPSMPREQMQMPQMEAPRPPTGEGYVPEELIGQDISEVVTPEGIASMDVMTEEPEIMQKDDPILYDDDEQTRWRQELDRIKQSQGAFSPNSALRMIDDKIKEGVGRGWVSEDDYLNYQQKFFGQGGENITNRINKYREDKGLNFAQGGRIGYQYGDQVTADSPGIMSQVSPSRKTQIEGNQELDRAYQQIIEKFYATFPGAMEEDYNIKGMVAMLQAEGVINQEDLEILGFKGAMDMITPESVDRSVQRISRGDTAWGDVPEEVFAYGGRPGYGLGSLVSSVFKGAKKAVKGLTKSVKKFAKSDLGKMALTYLATAGVANIGAGGWSGAQPWSGGQWLRPSNVMGLGDPTGWGNIGKSLTNLGLGTGAGGGGGGGKGWLKNVKIPGVETMYDKPATLGSKLLGSFKDNPMPWILGSSLGAGAYTAANPGKDNLDNLMGNYKGEVSDWDKIFADIRSGKKSTAFSTENTDYPYPNYMNLAAEGGRMGRAEGGLMNLGGLEKDYRAEGGFVPIGKKEKADDVPARLSVNEFVFTADAVRNAGGGDVDRGAEVMENVMTNLEQGGSISEESQGLEGARDMFEVSERLSEVV